MAQQMIFKRYEIKFLLTQQQRESLERSMWREHMVPDEWGPSTTRSLYLDTPSWLLARRSIESPRYKEKLRIRSYVAASADDEVFLELKKKFSGVVYKRRCVVSLSRARALVAMTAAPATQIEREIAFAAQRYQPLVPAMLVCYEREAYFDALNHEFRMTFDRNVRYRTRALALDMPTFGAPLMNEGYSLLEVKCLGALPLWLTTWLAENNVYKASFSKYGMAYKHLLLEGALGSGDAAVCAAEPLPQALVPFAI